MDTDKIYIKYTSHRSREKLSRLTEFQSYYVWADKGGAATGYALIPLDKLDEALEINGIKKCKQDKEFRQCISWS